MADGYGNIVTAWRCHVAAWVKSSTATTDTLHVEARWQAVNGYSLSGWVAATVWINGQQVGHVANSGVKNVTTNGEVTVCSGDLVVAKTDNARNITCSASIAFSSSWNGGTSNANVAVAVAGIQYSKPNAPSNLSIARVDDAAANLTWKNNPNVSALKPYSQIIIDKRTLTGGGSWGAWTTLAKLGGTTTNYKATGLQSNCRYQFRILARNTAGDSDHVSFQTISTTPAAPKSVTAVKTGASTVTVTADVSNSSPSWVTCWRTSDGGKTWTSLNQKIVPSNGKAIFTDTAAPAGTVQYRCYVRRLILGDGTTEDLTQTLVSATATLSNTVTTIAPPLAPTIIAPQSGSVWANPATVRVQWAANHPDGSAQTEAQVEATYPDGGTWTGDAGTADHYDLWCASDGTWSVRVRTKGLHADWGAWSEPVSFRVAVPPSVIISAPSGTVEELPVHVAWSAADSTGISSQQVTVSTQSGATATVQVAASAESVDISSSLLTPANGDTITVTVTVRGGSGLETSASTIAQIAYTPPAEPIGVVSVDTDSYAVTVLAVFGWKSGAPDTDHVSVTRVLPDGSELELADSLLDGHQVIDRLPPLNTTYQYRLTAYAESGAASTSLLDAILPSNVNVINFGTDAGEVLPMGTAQQVSRTAEHETTEFDFADGTGLETIYESGLVHHEASTSDKRRFSQNDWQRINYLAEHYAFGWFREAGGLREYAAISLSPSYDVTATPRTIETSATITRQTWKEPA